MKKFIFKLKKFSILPLDILIIVSVYTTLFFTVYSSSQINSVMFNNFRFTLLISLCSYLLFFLFTRTYDYVLRYSGGNEYFKICTAAFGAYTLTVVFKAIPGMHQMLNIKFTFLSNLVIISGIIAIRAFLKIFILSLTKNDSSKKMINVLIIGAGAAAKLFTEDLKSSKENNYNIVGYIDDNPEKKNRILNGYHVLGTRKDIIEICKVYKIETIVICMPSVDKAEVQKIVTICCECNCRVGVIPSYKEMLNSGDPSITFSKTIRDVEIEDLLERDPIILNNTQMSNKINNKVVLVTGGGGSIGSELCRQIVKYNPKQLIILDIYENNAYEIQNELLRANPHLNLLVIIASVRDTKKLDVIFDEYRPNLVYHAAAHKHVPLMEFSPDEAIKNNTFGTYNTAMCADKYEVETFTLISTDKAVNPTNVMGATKRMCEMIVQSMQEISKTEFVAVRFGNVLGSNGSVIPLFKKQIAQGGPVTVTDKEITRFFMTIPEAAQLVLQASAFANGGEIFVLDMGKPVKIYHLAEKLIKLSGYTPNVDMQIKIVGLRPGEKLYEELLMDEEGLTKTKNSKIFIGKPFFTNIEELRTKLDKLKTVLNCGDKHKIKEAICDVVDTYLPDFNDCNEAIEEYNIS